MKGLRFVLERWEHGWNVCKPAMAAGLDMGSLNEVMGLFEGEKLVVDTGISHHLRVTSKSPNSILVIVTDKASKQWREDIQNENSKYDPETAWWWGCNVGTSSASIFKVLTESDELRGAVGVLFPRSDVPQDSDDFRRCSSMVDLLNYGGKLDKVAEAYPETSWGLIIRDWDRLVRLQNDSRKLTEELGRLQKDFDDAHSRQA